MLRRLPLVSMAALLVVGCATTKGGSGPAETTTGVLDPCSRSVVGDSETARARLDSGRVDEALLYVTGLADCPAALAFPSYLSVAMDVYEELGRLNEAWSVARLQMRLAADRGERDLEERVSARLARFKEHYALVRASGVNREPPSIRYAGPVEDEATTQQLRAVAEGRGVWVDDTTFGYWLFPGRYEIDGEATVLKPGSVVGGQPAGSGP